ncbi:MAG: hypothetical protein M3461_10185 [Pseudomonadota bacterium]|nr:hypothetical protein [Pseudomonadota bacterium]
MPMIATVTISSVSVNPEAFNLFMLGRLCVLACLSSCFMCLAYALLSMARRIVQPIFFLERKEDQREDLSDERGYLAKQSPDLRVQDTKADTSGDDEDAAGPILLGLPPL